MKFLVMSDLHFEFHKDVGVSFVRGLREADGIIIAGDLSSFNTLRSSLKLFCDKYDTVVYVPGNHDYYGTTLPIGDEFFCRMMDECKNLTVLNADPKERLPLDIRLGDTYVFGTTLWFIEPGSRLGNPLNVSFRKMISDYTLINGIIEDVPKYADCSFRETFRFIKSDAPGKKLIVTHHLPHRRCIAKKHLGSRINIFFVNELMHEALERNIVRGTEPELTWIYGHTHTPDKISLGKMRLIANPLGYPQEVNHLFDDGLTIEL